MKKLLVCATLFALTACSSMRGQWDYDTQANFNQFKTYSWVEKGSAFYGYQTDGLTEKRVRHAVDRQLANKGLEVADRQSADLLVNYFTKIDQKFDIDTFHNQFGYHPFYAPGRFPGNYWAGNFQTQIREYQVGTLFIDLVNNKTGELIWRGAISKTLRNGKTPREKTEEINKSVKHLFTNFPPEPESK